MGGDECLGWPHADIPRCQGIQTGGPAAVPESSARVCIQRDVASPSALRELEFHKGFELEFKKTTMYLLKTRFRNDPSPTSHHGWSLRGWTVQKDFTRFLPHVS